MADRTSLPSQETHGWCFVFDRLSEAASAALASDLAPLLACGDVIALSGDLGMGKSSFARALLRARAGDPWLEVPSPTFTLVQGYAMPDEDGEASLEIAHFDLYRISDSEELYEIGFEESWEAGAALVEWPDRADDLLPPSCLWLCFSAGESDEARVLTIAGNDVWRERLMRLCQKRRLLIDAGWGDALRHPIASDLSPRSYDRVMRPQDPFSETSEHPEELQQTAILMDMPERQPGPLLPDGRLYDQVAHRVTALAPMLSIAEGLETLGLRVPHRFGASVEEGLMLWEDFGGVTLAEGPEEPVDARYLATVSALAHLHQQPLPIRFEGTGGRHTLSRYDRDAFEVELDVFLDHYWPHVHGSACPEEKRAEFKALWLPFIDRITETGQVLVLRDVQDPNCFWLGADARDGAIGFIDFQDCLIGPHAYDLAALSMDARVTIPASLEQAMRSHYVSLRGFDAAAAATFTETYHIIAAQRTSKNLGAFARAANQAGRTGYLAHVPRSLDYLSRAMDHPLLGALKGWYEAEGLLTATDR
nr:tRNA (adenosine(37)-N6)-threonylcarbamoyltransferase complex ATPase subunit type 1 TsaE [uncultured Cohaesibacter sp.]